MPKKKLTDAFVKSASSLGGKLTEYSDAQEKGLCLRITPSGVKSWTYRYRNLAGKQRRLSLGKVADVSLAQARTAVIQKRGSVATGADPAQEALAMRFVAKQEAEFETVAQLGEWYFKECEMGRHRPNGKPKRASTLKNERYVFESLIEKQFGGQSLKGVSRAQIQAFINLVADNSPSVADKCRAVFHGLCSFALRQDLIEANPCQFVSVTKLESRDRVLLDKELRTLWQYLTPPIDIPGASISVNVAQSILIAMVTLQRRSEITGMRVDEIDRENRMWTIPATRTKNGKVHLVPLSELALDLIDAVLFGRNKPSEYVFPSPVVNNAPIAANAMTRAFGRVRKALELSDVRPHDLRRTGATNLTGEGLGFQRFIVSRVLNHGGDTGGAAVVTGTYDRNEYLSEKRRALDAWAVRLQFIVSDQARSGNVVDLRR